MNSYSYPREFTATKHFGSVAKGETLILDHIEDRTGPLVAPVDRGFYWIFMHPRGHQVSMRNWSVDGVLREVPGA